MLVLGTEYLDLDQVERDFYSTRQDYAHSQQEVVIEERDLSKEVREEPGYIGVFATKTR